MAEHFVYILTNHSIPGLVKVGRTSTSPEQRVGELTAATGVASAFNIFHFYEVMDGTEAENAAHIALTRTFGRPNDKREFFSCSPVDAKTLLDVELSNYLTRPDIAAFDGPMTLLRDKSFTFAALEFESLFRQNIKGVAQKVDSRMASIFGAYLAACLAVGKSPIYLHLIYEPKLRHPILDACREWRGKSSSTAEEDLEKFEKKLGDEFEKQQAYVFIKDLIATEFPNRNPDSLEIAGILNQRGVPALRGNEFWSGSTVYRIIKSRNN